jgi:hypothetical protein
MVTTEGSYIEKLELQADSGIWQNMTIGSVLVQKHIQEGYANY